MCVCDCVWKVNSRIQLFFILLLLLHFTSALFIFSRVFSFFFFFYFTHFNHSFFSTFSVDESLSPCRGFYALNFSLSNTILLFFFFCFYEHLTCVQFSSSNIFHDSFRHFSKYFFFSLNTHTHTRCFTCIFLLSVWWYG